MLKIFSILLICQTICVVSYPNFWDQLVDFYMNYPGEESPGIHSYVPFDEQLTKWNVMKDEIASLIGDVEPALNPNSSNWVNSADTLDELYDLAEAAVPFFEAFNNKIVNIVDGGIYVNYGPNNSFITKTKDSMEDKANRLAKDGVPHPYEVIDDSIRGTFVCNEVSQVQLVVAALNEMCAQDGHLIIFDNKYLKNNKNGYIGVHSKIYFEVNIAGKNKFLLGELQIHFVNVFDGTLDCPKEYTHGTYKLLQAMADEGNPWGTQIILDGNAAQKIVFLYALTNVNLGSSNVRYNLKTIGNNPEYTFYYGSGLLMKESKTSALDIQRYDGIKGSWIKVKTTRWNMNSFYEIDEVQVQDLIVKINKESKKCSK